MTATHTFDESMAYLDGLYRRPLRPARDVGLARISYLLDNIGNPHQTFRSVHVAGSTGKGSTTTMIGDILCSGGLRTGYFRKPHLVSITERIAVGREDIDETAWESHWSRICPVIEAMETGRAAGYTLGRPAWFEVVFAIAALHFAESGIEWAAIETGLGGRLDATNVLCPDVAIVTNVSLEHTQILGSTVRQIAVEKAGIIKSGSHAVTGTVGEAREIIEDRARECGVPLLTVPDDIPFYVESSNLDGQHLRFPVPHELGVQMPLAGGFQAANAACAYAAIVALQARDVPIGDEHVVRALRTVRVPGRFEIVSREPMIILDGAHNPGATAELQRALLTLLPGIRPVLLFSAMADKDISQMAGHLGPHVDHIVITTTPGSDRSARPNVISQAFAPYGAAIVVEESPQKAFERARALAGIDRPLLVCGSMYLVGQLRKQFERSGAPA